MDLSPNLRICRSISSGRSVICTDSPKIGKVIWGLAFVGVVGADVQGLLVNSIVAITGRRSRDILQDPQCFRTVLLLGLGAVTEPKIRKREGGKTWRLYIHALKGSDDSTSACRCIPNLSRGTRSLGTRTRSLGAGDMVYDSRQQSK